MTIKLVKLITWRLFLTVICGTVPVSYGDSPILKEEVKPSAGVNLGLTPKVRDVWGTPSTVNTIKKKPLLSHPFAPWIPSPFQSPPLKLARRETNSWTGKLTEISAVAAGLRIALARPAVPSPNHQQATWLVNCQGWLLIPDSHQTLVRVALEVFWQNQVATFSYTLPDCLVTQLDWQREDHTVHGQVIQDQDVPVGMRKKRGPFGDRLVPAE